MQQPKPISLHSIMSNMKKQAKQNQNRKKSFSYSTKKYHPISEGQSILMNESAEICQKEEQPYQLLKLQHESFCQQLCDIFQTTYKNDEELILHIYSNTMQWKKDKIQFLQQDEVNNKVIQHYKLLLDQSNEIVTSQEEKILNQEELLIQLTQQIRDNNAIRSINTSHQERHFLEKIESMQSQIDQYRNGSQLTTFRRDESQCNDSKIFEKLRIENNQSLEEEILSFVQNTFIFYQFIGNQQITNFIKGQFNNGQLSLSFNFNQINNEIIKVLINKFDLDNDLEQEQQSLKTLKALRSSHNQLFKIIDQLGENVIEKLQNYKKNEISRLISKKTCSKRSDVRMSTIKAYQSFLSYKFLIQLQKISISKIYSRESQEVHAFN